MATFRLFVVSSTGLVTRKDSRYTTPNEARRVSEKTHGGTAIAWEDADLTTTPPTSQDEKYRRCSDAITQMRVFCALGQDVFGAQCDARAKLLDWAQKNGVNTGPVPAKACVPMSIDFADSEDDLGNTTPTATATEHARKMKAPIVLSHEFFRDADPSEIARRAHEATQAICKGT